MNKIKSARYVLGLEEVVCEGAAHVVHLSYKIGIQIEGAAVVMHPVYHRVMGLPVSHPREDVHVISPSLKSSGKLSNVRRNASNRNRMQGFPAEQCYFHLIYFRGYNSRLFSSYNPSPHFRFALD
jgi:hypothetical protein